MGEVEGTRRAWSYKGAVQKGLDVESYNWRDVPQGTWKARLDFKTWSNNTVALHLKCYFTSSVDGRRYQLSAYPSKQLVGRCYAPRDEGIDFSQRDLDGHIFLVTIGRTAAGKVSWLAAEFFVEQII